MFSGFTKETADFLWDIKLNNNRSWYNEHKELCKRVLLIPMQELANDIYDAFEREHPDNKKVADVNVEHNRMNMLQVLIILFIFDSFLQKKCKTTPSPFTSISRIMYAPPSICPRCTQKRNCLLYSINIQHIPAIRRGYRFFIHKLKAHVFPACNG